MKDKKLIVFDMYDTFVHIPKRPNLYRKFFSEFWLENIVVKELVSVLQISDKDIKDILSKEIQSRPGFDSLFLKLQLEVSKQFDSLSLYEDFLPTIQVLKQQWYATAVLSNLSKPYSYPLMHLIPKNTFDYQSLSYQVGAKKPDRKIFDHLKNISWYRSDEIVMVGDNLLSDVEWAKNAGIAPVHLDRTSNGIMYYNEYVRISRLDQLLKILET